MLSSPGSAVPSAGSATLQGKLVHPFPPVAVGEVSCCIWQPAEIMSNSLLRNEFPKDCVNHDGAAAFFPRHAWAASPGKSLLLLSRVTVPMALGRCPGCTPVPATPWRAFGGDLCDS